MVTMMSQARIEFSSQVHSKYVAAQWNAEGHRQGKNNEKKIDGLFIMHVLRVIDLFINQRKYDALTNALAIKTDSRIDNVIQRTKSALAENLTKCKQISEELGSVELSVHDTELIKIELPANKQKGITKNMLSFYQLFNDADLIAQEIYKCHKSGLLTGKEFRQLQFEKLKPLRVALREISILSKTFHQVRKAQASA